MSRNTSVILGEYYDKFIKGELEKGTYSSTSEVIRNGLRLLEERSKRIDLLNQALKEGEDSGTPLEWDKASFKAKMRKQHGKG